jgi:Protein kinase domain
MQGTILGNRYLIADEIGVGGMGYVYRATDLRTGGDVAVKVPHAFLTRNPEYIHRLQREAQIAVSIYSPRVVRVVDLDLNAEPPFLVMEYVPGQTLSDAIRERGHIDLLETLTIGMEIARALEAAYSKGVVHRDLKPQNIKIVDGGVKVLDFGIAKAEGYVGLTSASVFIGTPEYSAPERADGLGDIRSDIYSLGVIMFELLEGRPPFEGPTPIAVMRRHMMDPLPPLSVPIPDAAGAVVVRCLEKDPEDRFQTPAELAAELLAVIRELQRSPPPTLQLPVRPPLVTPISGNIPRDEPPATVTGGATVSLPPVNAPVVAAPDPAPRVPSSPLTAATTLPAAAVPARPGPEDAGGGRRVLLAVLAGAVLIAALAGAIYLLIGGGDGGSGERGGGGTEVPVGTADAGTPAPSTAPVAAPPATVTGLTTYGSGADFLEGRPPSRQLPAGGEVLVCYTFSGAGTGTALTLTARGPNSNTRVATAGPFTPSKTADVKCESLPGAAAFGPGNYVLVVEDRGQERQRGAFTILPPPTPAPTPAPTPEPTPEPTPPPTAVPATEPPRTAPPATAPPRTAPPVTAPPATAPPRTAPPATAPPATAPPATAPPVTAPPRTPPPATAPPATAPPMRTPPPPGG